MFCGNWAGSTSGFLKERDELLQCLLIAAPRGGETMIKVLEDLVLGDAVEKLFWSQSGDLV